MAISFLLETACCFFKELFFWSSRSKYAKAVGKKTPYPGNCNATPRMPLNLKQLHLLEIRPSTTYQYRGERGRTTIFTKLFRKSARPATHEEEAPPSGAPIWRFFSPFFFPFEGPFCISLSSLFTLGGKQYADTFLLSMRRGNLLFQADDSLWNAAAAAVAYNCIKLGSPPPHQPVGRWNWAP